MTQKATKMNAEKAIGTKALGKEFQITEKEVLLYAVGIGFSLNPLKEEDFKFTSEFSSQFSVFPTFSSTMRSTEGYDLIITCPHIPEFPPSNLLHGQEKLFMLRSPIKIGVTYQQQFEIVDIQDKGKNAVIIVRMTCFTKNQKGVRQAVYYIDRSYFIRGLGGFEFKGNNSTTVIDNPPNTKPDFQFVQKTYPNQCFVYRLVQDPNPLHIDPNFASLGGFQKPIIHGLASYGVVAKGLTQNLLHNNQDLIQSYQTKFIGHVFPGENLKVRVWGTGNRRNFEVQVVERGKKVIVGLLTIRQQAKL